MATDEVEEAILAVGAADVAEDVVLTWSVVVCGGVCARTVTSMSVRAATRVGSVGIAKRDFGFRTVVQVTI